MSAGAEVRRGENKRFDVRTEDYVVINTLSTIKKHARVILVCIAPLLAMPAGAELVAFEVESVAPAFEGRSFGQVGRYEIVRGIARYRVDPRLPVNAGLVNIHRAPREADGRVAFDADVVILRPMDLARGNQRLVYELVNRGRPLGVGLFNKAEGGTGGFDKAAHAGDGFLFEAGFTVVMSGWQAEYPIADAPAMRVALGSRLPRGPQASLLSARLPVAVGAQGQPVTGMTREQFFDVGTEPTFVGYLTYPAADIHEPAQLLVRESDAHPGTTPSGLEWRYIDPWRIEVTKPAGTTHGALYELVYRAKDPVIYGLGLASMRDLVSFLRYGDRDDNPLRLNERPAMRKVIGFGASQTGRTLKELVGEFNEDESGRIVLDAANILISGAGRNSLNSAFARPGLKDSQHTSWGLHGDEFPFSYPVTYDALSRRTDGVLARCSATRTCPRILHLDSENELWQGGTLTFIDTSGRDLSFPEDVRVFAFAGTEHSAMPQPGGSPICAGPGPSGIEWASFARALFVALDRWIVDGRAPPASRYPTVGRGELVPRDQYAFPTIREVAYTGAFSTKHYLDFTQEPPVRIATYPELVPQVDADGIMRGGVRHPFVVAPLATETGWNIRKPGFGTGQLCMARGMHLPFPVDAAEREARQDPRKSILERFPTEASYVKAVTAAAQALLKEELLLKRDAEAIIAEAPARYRAAIGSAP